MSLAPQEPLEYSNNGLFTCLSCSIAFHSADDQRDHYRSDHHRYNMKRRVAGLPPISAENFNQKVLERRAETAIMASPKGSTCQVCNKVYTSEGAYRSHIISKRHKENELKAAQRALRPPSPKEEPIQVDDAPSTSAAAEAEPPVQAVTEKMESVTLTVDADATEEEVTRTIEEKIAAARSRLQPTQCLFCTHASDSLEENIAHMSVAHSFFIPDAEYLVDPAGLLTYLGEKIAVGNVCIYCNGKGREFRTLDAVRKHMLDKGHCKLAYDTEAERLEISDFYDFTSSYPDAQKPRKKKRTAQPKVEDEADAEWEDMDADEDGEVDEVVDEEMSVDEDEDEETDEEDDDLPDNQITYGDSHYELVLPSGARIGHRSMKRYYAQSFRPLHTKPEDPNSGRALVRKLIGDKDSALVPRKGGYGAFGAGTDVVKARNRGEAREAGRHIREFRDQQRREQFKTKVGFIHNSQKHFRDPLLQ
ncbi:C2H2 type zinc-finger-domain-containing protein [Phanerochaete sordida]|uniref:C2H2 type zinc-finger-domain-containing protein n=1 Tax=Phanerochaete sordida TaxID=48140 RepID=A0A9P3LI76_9APHY|nr:C2H2 type zinc-finger-domain-containing protein [Phanerochaete sordida]